MYEPVNDDARDLAAAKNQNAEAFARLYDRHAPVVLSLCQSRFNGRRADSEDALQETFIRAYRKLHQVDDVSNLRPWLYSIARFVCTERLRSARRRTYYESRAMLNNIATSKDVHDDATAKADRSEQLACLDDALHQLSEREQLAIHLYYLDSDAVRAAAEALQLSRSGYYKLLARAREHLATLMKQAASL